MNALPNIDMDEVTRLTRAGRVADATALLQAGLGGRDRRPAASPPTGGPHIDLAAPRTAGGTWRLPDAPTRAPVPPLRPDADRPNVEKAKPTGALHRGDILRRFRSRPRPPSLPDGATFEAHVVRNDAGSLRYKLYVPSRPLQAPVALVVMLHGCTQDADDFAAGTRMNELAETYGFLAAYPEQSQGANSSRCWNWFRRADQSRDRGEPALMAAACRRILADHAVDPKRVFVAGLSAGGAAAAVLGCVYPDLFAGIGIHSGLACGAASDVPSAFAAMRGSAPAPALRRGSEVPTIIFHGTADRTVSPKNAGRIVEQQAGSGSLLQAVERGSCADGRTFTRTTWADDRGPRLEQWMVDGAGHAWLGGSPAGSYTDGRGPDASMAMLRFFGIVGRQNESG